MGYFGDRKPDQKALEQIKNEISETGLNESITFCQNDEYNIFFCDLYRADNGTIYSESGFELTEEMVMGFAICLIECGYEISSRHHYIKD